MDLSGNLLGVSYLEFFPHGEAVVKLNSSKKAG